MRDHKKLIEHSGRMFSAQFLTDYSLNNLSSYDYLSKKRHLLGTLGTLN